LPFFINREASCERGRVRQLNLVDYLHAQRLLCPVVCLGDGYDGVWNLFSEIAPSWCRCEILDWYHKENLYKVGGSLKRFKQAESLLW
jgi:hypothetical protein